MRSWFVVQDFSRYSSVQSYLNDLKWAPLKDHRRYIRLTFLFKIVTGRVAVQAEGALLPADSRTRHKHKHKYRHLPTTCNQCLNYFLCQNYSRSELLTKDVHHSGCCYRIPVTPALPSIVLRYDIPPIGAILLRGLLITEPEPGQSVEPKSVFMCIW